MWILFSLISSRSATTKFAGEKTDVLVTYYSMVKPRHMETNTWLSSLELRYASGSRQQMVRAMRALNLAETFWIIYPPANISGIHQSDSLKCDDRILLRQATSLVWLHSHDFRSPLNSGIEVSGFPDMNDDGNAWIIQCEDDAEEVTLDSRIYLKHAKMGCYLATSSDAEYPPDVGGNLEVYCDDSMEGNSWTFDHGIFVTGEGNVAEDDEAEYDDEEGFL